MVTKVREQIHMEETIIEDADLEKLLDDRQECKSSVAEFRKLDKQAKAKIQTIDKPMPLRVGRYIITRQTVQAKSVAFETDAGSRITIKHIGDE